MSAELRMDVRLDVEGVTGSRLVVGERSNSRCAVSMC